METTYYQLHAINTEKDCVEYAIHLDDDGSCTNDPKNYVVPWGEEELTCEDDLVLRSADGTEVACWLEI